MTETLTPGSSVPSVITVPVRVANEPCWASPGRARSSRSPAVVIDLQRFIESLLLSEVAEEIFDRPVLRTPSSKAEKPTTTHYIIFVLILAFSVQGDCHLWQPMCRQPVAVNPPGKPRNSKGGRKTRASPADKKRDTNPGIRSFLFHGPPAAGSAYRDRIGPGWQRMLADLKGWLEEGLKLPGRKPGRLRFPFYALTNGDFDDSSRCLSSGYSWPVKRRGPTGGLA